MQPILVLVFYHMLTLVFYTVLKLSCVCLIRKPPDTPRVDLSCYLTSYLFKCDFFAFIICKGLVIIRSCSGLKVLGVADMSYWSLADLNYSVALNIGKNVDK